MLSAILTHDLVYGLQLYNILYLTSYSVKEPIKPFCIHGAWRLVAIIHSNIYIYIQCVTKLPLPSLKPQV